MEHAQIAITPAAARQKINVLMLERVNNLLLSGEPELLRNESGRWVWRVPVDYTYGPSGRVGRVGEIDVDAHHGQVYFDDKLIAQIVRNITEIVPRESSSVLLVTA